MRKFLIIKKSEMNLIDYSQIPQDESNMTFNLEDTKTYIKWDTEEDPTFVSQLTDVEGPYNITEILDIILGPLWYDPTAHI